MSIQLITYNARNKSNSFPSITVSDLSCPRSLDEFGVNIIDLSDKDLWRNNNSSMSKINAINDFISLADMVSKRQNTIVVFVFPVNGVFLFNYSKTTKHFGSSEKIKDILPNIEDIIKKVIPTCNYDLHFEPTRTTINGFEYPADFYFDHESAALTTSELSNKPTTIKCSDYIYLTTLSIVMSEDALKNFVGFISPSTSAEVAPSWINSISFFNDNELLSSISRNEEIINTAKHNINEATAQLNTNNRYKSILYTNGDELVSVVFSILEELLSYDLSEFVDVKKEDFQIKKPSYTIIGEIKGVTSNVKSEHVSQVDVHYHGYMDQIAEEGTEESVFQLLIINPFRNKALEEREPVHETQINLAKRNNCLIIETSVLLKMFEKFKLGLITTVEVERLLTGMTGLLKESDFS